MSNEAKSAKQYATVNGRNYTVVTRGDGSKEIWTHFEIPVLADRWLACPRTTTRSVSVDLNGRLGKKVLKAVEMALDNKSLG